MHIPEGFAVVTPYLFVADAAAYARFLQAAFGAREIGRSTMPDGRIANCQLRFDSATIMISEASERFPPSSAAFYLYVADADARSPRRNKRARRRSCRSTTCPTTIAKAA